MRTTATTEPAPLPPPPYWRALLLVAVAHVRRWWPAIVLLVIAVATREAVETLDGVTLRAGLHGLSRWGLAGALGATAVNLVVMGAYDVVCLPGVETVGRRLLFGALAFAWSNFLTLGPVAGPAIRFWLYPERIRRGGALEAGIVRIAVGFAGGLAAWVLAALVGGSATTIAGGAIVAGIALGFVASRAQVRLAARLPWIGAQARWIPLLLLGVLDWGCAAAVFTLVLHAAGVPVDGSTLRAFVWGQALGVASFVPGGFGSADAFWLYRLHGPDGSVPAALIAYRLIYYVIPWATASLVLLRLAAGRGRRWLAVSRTVLASVVGMAGALLLLSAATPAIARRLALLEGVLPLPVLELSHTAAALTGLLLLVVARGLMKGFAAAHRLAMIACSVGAILCLAKGLDFEEAIVLTTTALLLGTQTPSFRRPSRGDWLGWPGLGMVALAVFLFAGFGLAVHDAQASFDLTVFGHHEEAARFARAAATLGLVTVVAILWVMLRGSVHFTPPTAAEIDAALALHAVFGEGANTLMVANGDKAIYRLSGDRGLCLYRTVGGYLVVYSDPSVAEPHRGTFVRELLEFGRAIDRRVVFYQVSAEWLPVLHDYGYHFFKLGEEALVHLADWSLGGAAHKALRGTAHRLEREGFTFAVVAADGVSALLPDLRRVSEAWLAAKDAREKQFSIGFFDPAYLTKFPCAVVHDRPGRIVAFANLLPGPRNVELSIDLMRHDDAAPPGTMDFLFVRLLAWGREQGYTRFNLGMAPLATVGALQEARPSERLAHVLFQHGEQWYNFRGLRQYKDKFHPEWAPRYLAYPDAWEWIPAMAQVTRLINAMGPATRGRGTSQRAVPAAPGRAPLRA